jgi:hypothetical protein
MADCPDGQAVAIHSFDLLVAPNALDLMRLIASRCVECAKAVDETRAVSVARFPEGAEL